MGDYLPLAKATIQETCTLVAATQARFNQILVPVKRRYVFSKQYGDIAKLKMTFPAGVTEKILSLKIQVTFSMVQYNYLKNWELVFTVEHQFVIFKIASAGQHLSLTV